ncbi:MAG: tetratricopeptide repeat protein [Phycisphaerales bacterium]|nr:tetratricopeptide repeat protein [Phycisphaerales bacterium]
MTPDRLRKVERIYAAVLDAPEVDRAAALDAHCAGDHALRAEVESLLSHAGAMGGFLATPVMGPAFTLASALDDPLADELIGRSIGAYTIVTRVASGGMGSVYKAARSGADFEQTVALKVVNRGMDSEEILRRFRRERQTLASLNHPNIARLFDGGITPDGRPYLVMEFVDGTPLDVYCRHHRLTLRERLVIFDKVCAAVASAHRALVVHRDLKPANILVTAQGEPKLLDFGIAGVLTPAGTTAITAPTERRLTPDYASPEQVMGGPIGTASDVYSLGAVLYELITGARAHVFSGHSTPEIERVIRDVVPPPPSIRVATEKDDHASLGETSLARLSRHLAGDLDTIVLTALRKEPERRYAGVELLALDIRAYLDDRPIAARPDTLRYRAAKFIRRNTAACIAGLIVIGVVAGSTALVWRQARIATLERDAAFEARDQSEEVVAFFEQMLASADPREMGRNATIRAVVDQTALGLLAQFGDRPVILARLRSAIGRTYMALGLLDEAARELETARDIRDRELQPDHHDRIESLKELSELRFAQRRLDEAESLARETLARHIEQRGDDNPDTAEAWSNLGAILRARGTLEESERSLTRAIDIYRAMRRPPLALSDALNNLAGVWLARGELARAESLLDESRTLREKFLDHGHVLRAQSLHNLGQVAVLLNKIEEGRRLLSEAIAEYGLEDAAPALPLARAHADLANVLGMLDRNDECIAHFAAATRLFTDRLGHDSPEALDTQVDLAEARRRSSHTEQSRVALEDVVARCEAVGPALDATRARAYFGLSAVWKDIGNAAKSDEFLKKAEYLESSAQHR